MLALAVPAEAATGLERREVERVLIEARDALDSARTKLAEGDKDTARRRLREAEDGFRSILDGDPSHRPAAAGLGAVLYIRGGHEEAITLLQPLVEAAPDDIDVVHQLGLNLYKQGRHDDAIPHLEKAATDTARIDAMWILSVYYYRQSSWEKGLPHLQRYAEARSDDARAEALLGTYLLKLSRFDEAIASFDRFLEHHPDNIAARINRANAMFRSGRDADAAAAYEALLRDNPERSRLAYNLAAIRMRQGMCRDAVSLFDTFLRAQRDHPTALYFKGDCQLLLGDLDGAAKTFERVVVVTPSNPWAHHGLSRIAYKRGDLDQAIQRAREAAGLLETDWELASWLGTLLRRATKYEEALSWHDKAAELAPEEPSVHVERGRDLWALGRYDRARDAFADCLRLDPEYAGAREMLAAALVALGSQAREQGDLETARQRFGAAFMAVSGYEPAAVNLALLELGAGAPDAAHEALSRAEGAPSPDRRAVAAAVALARDQLDAAGQEATAALEAQTQLPSLALQVRGHVLGRQGAWAEAAEAFGEALALSDDPALSAARTLARLHAGLDQLGNGDARGALAVLREVSESRAELAAEDVVLLDFALAAGAVAGAGKSGQAVGKLERLLASATYKKPAWRPLADIGRLYLARAHLDAGRVDKALAAAKAVRDRRRHEATLQAIERGARDREARDQFATGKHAKAAAIWKKLVASKPDATMAHNLAVARFETGDVNGAVSTWAQQAESASPAESLFNLAVARDRQARYEEAFALFERYLTRRGVATKRARERVDAKKRALGLGGGS